MIDFDFVFSEEGMRRKPAPMEKQTEAAESPRAESSFSLLRKRMVKMIAGGCYGFFFFLFSFFFKKKKESVFLLF
jgi:hypothetical protein